MVEALGLVHLGFFVLAGWMLNLTPGLDVLYIVSSSLRSGARAGVVAALGITAGCFVHIFAAALGVTALLAASTLGFTVLKWVGGAYLLYSGVRMLLTSSSVTVAEPGAQTVQALPGGLWAVFRAGFLTNALNPKVALFFLAFVPQFIAPDAPHQALAFLVLGLIFNVNALPVNIGFALLAAWAVRRLQAVQRATRWLNRVAGVMFVGFGVKLLFTSPTNP